MNTTISAPLFAGSLFVGMLLVLELGRRLGSRRLQSESARGGFGAVEGAIFALFGLLVAFTFSGAASRFDSRRALVADEANAIGTAYLRLDLLASGDQSDLREMFRGYLDSRLEVYRKLPDLEDGPRGTESLGRPPADGSGRVASRPSAAPRPIRTRRCCCSLP